MKLQALVTRGALSASEATMRFLGEDDPTRYLMTLRSDRRMLTVWSDADFGTDTHLVINGERFTVTAVEPVH